VEVVQVEVVGNLTHYTVAKDLVVGVVDVDEHVDAGVVDCLTVPSYIDGVDASMPFVVVVAVVVVDVDEAQDNFSVGKSTKLLMSASSTRLM
jgi:hypothetical protein